MQISKRGAIELSISTIVVIVLGVTLLSLGLVFIRNLVSNVTTLSEESFRIAEKLIQEQMSPNEKFFVSGLAFEIERGKSTLIFVGINNIGQTASDFSVEVTPSSQDIIFTVPPVGTIGGGERKGVPVQLSAKRTAPAGSAHTFTVRALRGGVLYDSQGFIVNIKGVE